MSENRPNADNFDRLAHLIKRAVRLAAAAQKEYVTDPDDDAKYEESREATFSLGTCIMAYLNEGYHLETVNFRVGSETIYTPLGLKRREQYYRDVDYIESEKP